MGSPAGVYVGCIWLEYGELLRGAGLGSAKGGAQAVTGNGLAFMAGRVSYTFGLTGGGGGSRASPGCALNQFGCREQRALIPPCSSNPFTTNEDPTHVVLAAVSTSLQPGL